MGVRRLNIGLNRTSYALGKAPFNFDYPNYPPTISFSGAEDYVHIQNQQRHLIIKRPVVTPWVFTPTIYVSKAGNDSTGTGSSAAPYLTINKALSVYVAGDVIAIRAGTYTEDLTSHVLQGTSGHVSILTCATVAQGGGGLGSVILKQTDANLPDNPVANILNARQYALVNGMVFAGARGNPVCTATTQQSGIIHSGAAGTNLFTAQNCVVYDSTDQGIKVEDNAVCKSNIIFGCGRTGLHHGIYAAGPNITGYGNITFSNFGYGLHWHTGATAIGTVTRNLSFGNGGGHVIDSQTNVVQYNTFAYNHQNMEIGGSGIHTDESHNILAFPVLDGITGAFNLANSNFFDPTWGPTNDNVDNFTCRFGDGDTSDGSYLQITPGANSIKQDPAFVDAVNGNFVSGNAACAAMGCYGA